MFKSTWSNYNVYESGKWSYARFNTRNWKVLSSDPLINPYRKKNHMKFTWSVTISHVKMTRDISDYLSHVMHVVFIFTSDSFIFTGCFFFFFLHTRRFFLYYSFISMWVFSRVQEFFRRNSFIFLVLLLLVVFAHFRWNFIFSDVKFFVWSCDHIVHTMFSWVVQFQDVTCTLKCTFTCYFLFLLLTHLYVVKTYQYMWNVCDFSVKEPRELFNPQKLYYWII